MLLQAGVWAEGGAPGMYDVLAAAYPPGYSRFGGFF